MKNIKNKGFTLLELLVSLAIVSIAILTIFTAINSNLKVNTKNDKDIKSLQIAQSEIENLRSQIKSKSSDKFKILTYDLDRKIDKEIEIVVGETYDYLKIIDNDANIYNVELAITKDSKDLYKIDIKVKSNNEKFSKKTTEIITKVFGK